MRAIEADPRDGRAWLALARGEAKRRNFEQAVGLFKRGLKYSPENVHLLQAYGVCLEKAGRPMLAMKLCADRAPRAPRAPAASVAQQRRVPPPRAHHLALSTKYEKSL